MDQATSSKSFAISKHLVVQAYELVKSNRGGAGIDRVSLDDFEKDRANQLYKVWNRLSSGSYHPPPVRRVDIPKATGGTRPLGIPTVADRIAQMVVKLMIEPMIEPLFHRWSYGYRPGVSALDAVAAARRNCWAVPWVVDVDIRGFFDTIDHSLLLKAVRRHVTESWQILYIERWLKAPVLMTDGTVVERDSGTPQGGVISPLLANLFLHYVFDAWMDREQGTVKFERYADDIICHCASRRQAEELMEALRYRFSSCGLTLHPDKSKIVFCRSNRQQGSYPATRFTFLGYEFRPRRSMDRRGAIFMAFLPAIAPVKVKAIRERIRQLTSPDRTIRSLTHLVYDMNPVIRGVYNYFGRFGKGVLHRQVGRYINDRIMHWGRRKYKRLRGSWYKAGKWVRRLIRERPGLFCHWPAVTG